MSADPTVPVRTGTAALPPEDIRIGTPLSETHVAPYWGFPLPVSVDAMGRPPSSYGVEMPFFGMVVPPSDRGG
jgi:hypothetical protein